MKFNNEISQGVNPNKKKGILRDEPTLDEFYELYIKRYGLGHKSKSTLLENTRQYKSYFQKLHKRKLSEIENDTLIDLHSYIKENHGLYAANRALSLLQGIFNKAIEWGWEGKNPAQGIKKFKEKSRDRFLQGDELPKFWDAVVQETNIAARDYIILSLLTGARKGNTLAMCWDDVYLEIMEWKIPETKNGESLTIPLSPEAIMILEARKKESTCKCVFPSPTTKSGHIEDYSGLKNQDKILRILLPIIKQHFSMPINKHSWAFYSQC